MLLITLISYQNSRLRLSLALSRPDRSPDRHGPDAVVPPRDGEPPQPQPGVGGAAVAPGAGAGAAGARERRRHAQPLPQAQSGTKEGRD